MRAWLNEYRYRACRRKFRGCQAITTARKSPAFRARTAMTIAKADRDSRRTLKLIANLLAEAI